MSAISMLVLQQQGTVPPTMWRMLCRLQMPGVASLLCGRHTRLPSPRRAVFVAALQRTRSDNVDTVRSVFCTCRSTSSGADVLLPSVFCCTR
jgi:hypothetical protein